MTLTGATRFLHFAHDIGFLYRYICTSRERWLWSSGYVEVDLFPFIIWITGTFWMGIDPKRSLQYLSPIIAALWHPTKNGNLTPDDITSGSRKMSSSSVRNLLVILVMHL